MSYEEDYYGIKITTHEKDECTEMMEDILFNYRDIRESLILSQGSIENTWIPEHESDILIEYAPKLFNTLPLDQDLYEVMEGFVRCVNLWCNNNRVKQWVGDKMKDSNPSHQKKSIIYKEKVLKDSIDNIINLIGESNIPKEVQDYFDNLVENAKTFLDHSHNLEFAAKNKSLVEKYLIDLHLPKKSKQIKEFLPKL